MHHLIVVVVAVVALCFCHVTNAIVLPHHISSHMVLPRSPLLANIWGYETPGFTVTVQHDSVVRSAVADADGNWLVTLPPTGVLFDQTIIITTSSNKSEVHTLIDVAFGDVYLCSGQSNMELTLEIIFGGKALIADSINYPNIRLFPIRRERDKKAFNDTKSRYGPQEPWVRAAPQYLNGSVFDYFSAVCYVYGLELSRGLGGVIPIGLVESSYGGTKIELWTSPEGIKQCPIDVAITSQKSSVDDEYIKDSEMTSDIGSYSSIDNSIVYFGMISPILPMKFKSVIWYQGESNDENSTLYSCRFPALIQDWRQQFQQPDLPFYFVLLAPSTTILNDPLLRNAQLHGLTLANVSVASAIDLGDSFSPEGSIHPRNKTILGSRLADIALYNLYGQTKRIISGPVETSPYVFHNSSHDRVVSLQLTYAVTPDTTYNAGLRLSGTAQCDSCCNVTGSPIQFLLLDSRTGLNISVRTSIVINGGELTASADLSSYPNTAYVSVIALEWDNQPQCIIANAQFIPQLPSYRLIQDSGNGRKPIAQQ